LGAAKLDAFQNFVPYPLQFGANLVEVLKILIMNGLNIKIRTFFRHFRRFAPTETEQNNTTVHKTPTRLEFGEGRVRCLENEILKRTLI
jgi:hypothetical protein